MKEVWAKKGGHARAVLLYKDAAVRFVSHVVIAVNTLHVTHCIIVHTMLRDENH